MAESQTSSPAHAADDWTEWDAYRRSPPEPGRRSIWPVVGLGVAVLGVLAWYHFKPELDRYLKIKSM